MAAVLAWPAWAMAAGTHMSEELRSAVSKVVILPIDGESNEAITGTYKKDTDGLQGGMARGAQIGQIPVEVGQVPINVPIPILRELGMLFGGLKGATKRQIQDLRDRMVEDLSREVEQPLSNNALATDVYWGLRNIPTVDPKLFAVTTPIPPDTDAILYVSINEITLNVQEDEAIVATVATARLQKYSDGKLLYRKEVTYEDRDKLKTWSKDNYRLWEEYREYARHYIAREVAAELYERVAIARQLEPADTDSLRSVKKNQWQATTKSLSPAFAWTFALQGDGVVAAEGAEVSWDLEIYGPHHPVYEASGLQEMHHRLLVPLEACTTYRWSVRPVYQWEGSTKNGEWMRSGTELAKGNGNVGRAISEAHAYVQDFPSFEVDCRAK